MERGRDESYLTKVLCVESRGAEREGTEQREREKGREGERKGGREGGREEGRERKREGQREGGRERDREKKNEREESTSAIFAAYRRVHDAHLSHTHT